MLLDHIEVPPVLVLDLGCQKSYLSEDISKSCSGVRPAGECWWSGCRRWCS